MSIEKSIKAPVLGKAYEYACLSKIEEMVGSIRPVETVKNSSYLIAKRYFEEISSEEQDEMRKSAQAGLDLIIQMEPRIIEDGNDKLTISLQADSIAKSGDIRDIIIIRRAIKWEIGISVKHNHAALKHSRLSPHIDFGKEWFQAPCSEKYFEDIKPVFNKLTLLKAQNLSWKDLANKEDDVYIPLLKAFMNEMQRLFDNHREKITAGLVNYLLGSNGNDYYKLIHYNNHKTRVLPFNVYGTLNQDSGDIKPKIKVKQIKLPTRIFDLSFKENSKTTIILTMNNGWAISFRIHNASTFIEESLKFDIQLEGQPASLFYLDAEW